MLVPPPSRHTIPYGSAQLLTECSEIGKIYKVRVGLYSFWSLYVEIYLSNSFSSPKIYCAIKSRYLHERDMKPV
jgi:hypothetical protein